MEEHLTPLEIEALEAHTRAMIAVWRRFAARCTLPNGAAAVIKELEQTLKTYEAYRNTLG